MRTALAAIAAFAFLACNGDAVSRLSKCEHSLGASEADLAQAKAAASGCDSAERIEVASSERVLVATALFCQHPALGPGLLFFPGHVRGGCEKGKRGVSVARAIL